jgi:hypothetical protein
MLTRTIRQVAARADAHIDMESYDARAGVLSALTRRISGYRKYAAGLRASGRCAGEQSTRHVYAQDRAAATRSRCVPDPTIP